MAGKRDYAAMWHFFYVRQSIRNILLTLLPVRYISKNFYKFLEPCFQLL